MLPTAPTLNAATAMSSSTTRAWSATQSASITWVSSTRAVSPIRIDGDDRQAVATHCREGREIGLDADGADGVGNVESQDERRSLVLHSR